MPDNLTPRERARNTVDEHFRVLTYAELVESIAAAIEAAVADYRTLPAEQAKRADALMEQSLEWEGQALRMVAQRDAAEKRADGWEKGAKEWHSTALATADERDAAIAREAALRRALEPIAAIWDEYPEWMRASVLGAKDGACRYSIHDESGDQVLVTHIPSRLLHAAHTTLSAPSPGLEQGGGTFEKWWQGDGRFFDPDTADVPWCDKRKGLAEYAYSAGLQKAGHSARVDGRTPEVPVVPNVVGERASSGSKKSRVSPLRQMDGGEGCATLDTEALDAVRREAQIEALEGLPCKYVIYDARAGDGDTSEAAVMGIEDDLPSAQQVAQDTSGVIFSYRVMPDGKLVDERMEKGGRG